MCPVHPVNYVTGLYHKYSPSQREREKPLKTIPARSNMQVTVIGAGFSGLVTAYYLVKEGFTVQIVERKSRPGGLIQTIQTEHGLVETAANGIRNSARLEAMCADIRVPLETTRREARARFIFRGSPKRFPLSAPEVLKLGFRFAASASSLRPRPFETIVDWGRRVIGKAATGFFLAPALSGIYAGDPERLSASLDHRHRFRNSSTGWANISSTPVWN